MPVMELTKDNFDSTIKQHELVLVDFWASWCQPCKSFAVIYEDTAKKYPNIIFGKINTETEPELANEFQIRSIPTLMVIREEVVLFADSGSMPASALVELIDQALSVDMAAVKQQLSDADK